MPATWKINGTLAATGGFSALKLSFVNQQADALTFEEQISATASPTFDIDDTVTLIRDESGETTWFKGKVRAVNPVFQTRREAIRYEVRGPWDDLARTPYLQAWKVAGDPTDEDSALVDQIQSRVVLGQANDGTKTTVAIAINDVITAAQSAGANIAPGTITAGETIPFDEVNDLTCADAISRILSWVPSAVCWIDYSPATPTFNLALAGTVTPTAIDFDDGDIGAINLSPRPDLQVSAVVLLYRSVNRANTAQWVEITKDAAPLGTETGAQMDALVRTIEMAGSTYQSTVLEQKVVTAAIPAALETGGLTTSGGTFSALSNWWKEKHPWLQAVTILGFRNGDRTSINGGAYDGALVNELTAGAVTDWMDARQNVDTEEQRVQVEVAYNITVDSITERRVQLLETTIVATNATTRTYSYLVDDSFTSAEGVPVGLAAAIYDQLSVLQYDGTITLIESEATARPGPGALVRITNSKAAWSTMRAVVQSAAIDIDRGETTLTVGPPRQLGPDDLVELFRINRNRQPSTSWFTRNTGSFSQGESTQGLGVFAPSKPGSTLHSRPPRIYDQTVTVAGVVPTSAELTTAIEAAFSASNMPQVGDTIQLLISSAIKFRAQVTSQDAGTGSVFNLSFDVNGDTFYAVITQVGLI